MLNKKYHLFYNESDLNTTAINILRILIKEKHFFKQDEQTKLNLLKQLSEDLSEVYNIQKPSEVIIINNYFGIGGYNPLTKIIVLNKCSLVTFLHEFKHHLNSEQQTDDSEETARGFSHSLYYQATPNLFKNAVEKGLLVFQKSM